MILSKLLKRFSAFVCVALSLEMRFFMFYVPSEYSNYKYLVDFSDNYIILSNQSLIQGSSGDSDSIPCIIQYLNPSITTIESTYTSESYSRFTDISSQFDDSIFNRSDFPSIFICNFIILFTFAFIINQLSKLVYKGGLFGSN